VINIRYALIRDTDVANGEGIGVSLFVQGCEFYCKGCFNQETWDFNGGKEWTKKIETEFIDLGDRNYIKGFTILGGEPMHPTNIETVSKVIHDIKVRYPNKTVWVYSGFIYDYLLEHFYYSLANIDLLVDGQFIEEQRDLTLRFRGSKNQRLIDVQKSLKEGKVILWE
jgi:anaerobic ribonucleoside-triphosphate reductase activating protein